MTSAEERHWAENIRTFLRANGGSVMRVILRRRFRRLQAERLDQAIAYAQRRLWIKVDERLGYGPGGRNTTYRLDEIEMRD